MNWLPSRHVLPWWLLIISLAFNVGFGATYGVRTYSPAPASDAKTDGDLSPRLMIYDELELSEAQREELEQINRDLLEQINAIRKQMFEARRALADLIIADETDQDAIERHLDEMSDIQRRMQQLVVEHLLLERQLLGPEQRARFDDMIQRRIFPGRPDRGHGGGRGGRRGPDRDRGAWRGPDLDGDGRPDRDRRGGAGRGWRPDPGAGPEPPHDPSPDRDAERPPTPEPADDEDPLAPPPPPPGGEHP
jgi:Spy/CpxP family protein refolding chaperone